MNNVSIVVDAVYKGSPAFRQAQGDLNKLNSDATGGAAKFGAAFSRAAMGVATIGAALGAAAIAGKALYSTLRAGAALVTTRERFDKLSESINTTSDALLGNLRAATKGMIDDMTLMASASQIISLRLADNEGQVTRLATVVGTLGWDMQQVILTFANMSTMRLDALGLSVEEVKNKAAELEKQGYSTAEAFKEAVIQAGEARLDVGGVSEAEQAFKRAETAVTNFKNALLESVVVTLDQAGAFRLMAEATQNFTGFSSFVNSIDEMVRAGELAESQYDELRNILRRGGLAAAEAELAQMKFANAVSQSSAQSVAAADAGMAAWAAWGQEVAMAAQLSEAEYKQWLATVGLGTDITLAGLNRQGTGFIQWSNTVVAAAMSADRAMLNFAATASATAQSVAPQAMTNRYAGWVRATNERNRAAEESRAAALEEASAVGFLGGAIANVITAEEALAAAHGRLADAFSQEVLAPVEDGLIDAAGVVNMEAANKALFQQAQAAGATAAQLALLGVATGQFTEEQAQAALKAAVLQEKIKQIAAGVASGQLSYGEAAGGLASFGEALNSGALGEVAGGIEGVAQAATDFASGTYEAELSVEDAAARAAILDILELIGDVSGTHYINFVTTHTDEQGGGGGATSGGGSGSAAVSGPAPLPGDPTRMGGRSSYTVPMGTQTYQADYRSSTAAGASGRGLTEYQGGATYNVTVNNFVDGKAAPKQDLDDVTVDKLRAALDAIGVRR